MPRRRLPLVLNGLLVLLAALLGLASDYLANAAGVPAPFRLLQQWSLPLAGITLVLVIGVQVWLYLLERPPSPKRAWDSSRPPYPGLEAFVEQDAGVFFGREPQISELLDRLHPTLPDHAHRFVAVIGPSGAGKSSLVQAGLLPRLAQRRHRWVVVPPFVPGEQPTLSLASSLATALPGTTPGALAAEFAPDLAALIRRIEELRAVSSGRSVLLVIDQAEELLTRAGEHERAEFLALLDGALRDDPRLWVVATLRSEFLTGLLTTGFADLFRNPVVIGALDRAALFQVIEGPAAQASLAFAPGVVSWLVDDTGGGDALPLLAYTLQALYLRVGYGGVVTAEDYRQLGGVAGALSQQADRVAAELRAAEPSAPVLSTLLKFVTLDETEPSRRHVRRSILNDAQRKVVDAFVAARLLTSDAAGDDAAIAVAHEALFRQWPPLRQAIEARVDDLRQRAELERWAQDWVRSGHKDSYLLRDERLEIAQQWAAGHGNLAAELPLVHEFLECSRRSDHAAMKRLSEAVARRALATVHDDPEQGVLLALAAIEECTPTPLAQQALFTTLAASRIHGVLRGHRGGVRGVAWSPDGQRLATVADDRTARVWDAEAGIELVVLRGHEDGVWGVAWSPDGQRLVTASGDRTARVWDAEEGAELAVLRGHEDGVRGVAWSPDGQRLVTVSRDCTTRVWDVEAGVELVVLRGHEDWVEAVAWSPDGQRIVTVSYDRTVRVWDVEAGVELVVLRGHEDWVEAVAWSPGGQRLVTVSRDCTVRVWDVEAGVELAVLRGHTDWVRRVAWSPDGQRIATASGDRTTRVWGAEAGTELAVLRGHTDWVQAVVWSFDGQRLATASDDRTVRVWDAEAGVELAVLCGHEDVVRGVAWSPDGLRIATSSYDRTARVWDAEEGIELAVLRGHEDGVRDVVWSPDGQRLVTASHDCTVRVWDAEAGVELAVLRGHTDWVRRVAWSPDGQRIATASGDRTARVWDAETGAELAIVGVHEHWVEDVAWSPDGKRIATASRDRTARIWDALTDLDALLAKAHTRVFRQLTVDERKSAMLPERPAPRS